MPYMPIPPSIDPFKDNQNIIKKGKVPYYRASCSECETEFKFRRKDMEMETTFTGYVKCPLCEINTTASIKKCYRIND